MLNNGVHTYIYVACEGPRTRTEPNALAENAQQKCKAGGGFSEPRRTMTRCEGAFPRYLYVYIQFKQMIGARPRYLLHKCAAIVTPDVELCVLSVVRPLPPPNRPLQLKLNERCFVDADQMEITPRHDARFRVKCTAFDLIGTSIKIRHHFPPTRLIHIFRLIRPSDVVGKENR